MEMGVNAPPLHPSCRCSTAAYMDREEFEKWLSEQGVHAASSRVGSELLEFNSNADYSINLPGYSKEVQRGLSSASREVARLGGKDGLEHLVLVDLKNGNWVYEEVGGRDYVGGEEFWKFIKKHQGGSYAFVHNHNIVSSLSIDDASTLATMSNIRAMIAIQNDGLKYMAVSNGATATKTWYDELYKKELESLNKASKDGKISAIERVKRREEIIVNSLLNDYAEGMEVQDGRK